MTPDELQEIRDWSARVVIGWIVQSAKDIHGDGFDKTPLYRIKDGNWQMPVKDWRPDNPSTGQIWMVVERMRELGWKEFALSCYSFRQYLWTGVFAKMEANSSDKVVERQDDNPCIAILLAARAAILSFSKS